MLRFTKTLMAVSMMVLLVGCGDTLEDSEVERQLPSENQRELGLTRGNGKNYLTSCLRGKMSDLKRLQGTSEGSALLSSCEISGSALARSRFVHRSFDGNYAVSVILNRYAYNYPRACGYFFDWDCSSWRRDEWDSFYGFYFPGDGYDRNDDCERKCYGVGFYQQCYEPRGLRCWNRWRVF